MTRTIWRLKAPPWQPFDGKNILTEEDLKPWLAAGYEAVQVLQWQMTTPCPLCKKHHWKDIDPTTGVGRPTGLAS